MTVYPSNTPARHIEEVNNVLGVTEAAEVYGVHPNTVRYAIVHGKVVARKMGDRYAISKSSLENWFHTKDGEYPHVTKF